ncbi:MAG: PLP-dependent aminotransferase family protein [Pseudomonadota bacterium]
MEFSDEQVSYLGLSADHALETSLQEQLYQQILLKVVTGAFPVGMRLPPTRKLSDKLKVSRNTAAAVYDRLISEGLVVSRSRSGVFVSSRNEYSASFDSIHGGQDRKNEDWWTERFSFSERQAQFSAISPDWEKFPFPFIERSFDQSLFPVSEWREATRKALSVSNISSWSRDFGDADFPPLIEEIQRRVLPKRDPTARRDEILITSGAHHGLHLVIEIFVRTGTVVGIEEPCNPELLFLLQQKRVRIEYFAVDDHGVVLDEEKFAQCDVFFTSPGRQRPTGVAMSPQRRAALVALAKDQNVVLIEDDHHWEVGVEEVAQSALLAKANGAPVVYVSTLAQPLAAAIRLGVLIAPAPVIRAARALRRLYSRQPALSLQCTFAQYLAMGHYDTSLHRVRNAFDERMGALRDALNHYFPQRISMTPSRQGSAGWVTGPKDLDVGRMARLAEARGVLIGNGADYFSRQPPQNIFRLGVSGIAADRIREGIARVSAAFRDTLGPGSADPDFDPLAALTGAKLKRALSGATILCKTVYGEPCKIKLHRSGAMSGEAGFANEENDIGQWTVEGDYWQRRWRSWAYGEAAKFRVVINDNRISWYNADGRLIDWGVIIGSS